MPEILNLVKAFRTTDASRVPAPANRQPGDRVVVQAPVLLPEWSSGPPKGTSTGTGVSA